MNPRGVLPFRDWLANGAEPITNANDSVEAMLQTGQIPVYGSPEAQHPIFQPNPLLDFAKGLAQRENLLPTLEILGQRKAAILTTLRDLEAKFDATKATGVGTLPVPGSPGVDPRVPSGFSPELKAINRLKTHLVHLDAFISGIQDPESLQAWVGGLEHTGSLPEDIREVNIQRSLADVPDADKVPDPEDANPLRRAALLGPAVIGGNAEVAKYALKGDFSAAVFNSWARTVMAVRAIPQLKGWEAPTSAADSQAIGLAAMGWIADPDDPVLNMLTHVTRSQFARTRPRTYDLIRRGVKFGEENLLAGFAAEAVAFAPIAVIEAAATHGAVTAAGFTGARALAVDVALNTALGAFEGYAFTPGDEATRTLGAALGGTIGAGATAGLGGGALALRGALDRSAARAAAPGPEAIQLSKLLRGAPDLLTSADDPLARRAMAAVQADLIDAGDLLRVWDSTAGLGRRATPEARLPARLAALGEHVDRVLKDATDNVSRPWDGTTSSTFRAQARSRAVGAADALVEAYRGIPVAGPAARRLVRDVRLAGGTTNDVLAVMRGPADPGYRDAVRRYTETVAEQVADEVEEKVRRSAGSVEGPTSGDLDHMANRLHQLVFEARVTGIDTDWDVKLFNTLAEDITGHLRASHPDIPEEGRQALAGRVTASGKRGIPGFARPMLRFAIDLFADPRPGRTAVTNVHEMAHIWAVSLESLRPATFRRLASEVAEIYARHTKGVVAEELDPRRVGELFANLLTNHALLNEMTAGGETFLVKMHREFGRSMGRLLDQVVEWKSRHWVAHTVKKGGRKVQVMGDVRKPWSDELTATARQFSKGDWRGIMHDLAGLTKPTETPDVRVTFGGSKFFESADTPALRRGAQLVADLRAGKAGAVDQWDAWIKENGASAAGELWAKSLDDSRGSMAQVLDLADIAEIQETTISRRLKLQSEVDLLQRQRDAAGSMTPAEKGALTRRINALRAEAAELLAEEKSQAFKIGKAEGHAGESRTVKSRPMTLKGVGTVRVAHDVSGSFWAPVSRLDFEGIMSALVGGKAVVWDVNGEKWDLTRAIRYMATWYDRGREGAELLTERLRELGRELDPGNPFWEKLDTRTTLAVIGVTAARKGPVNNLQAAVRALAYQSRNPGGHYAALEASVFRATSVAMNWGTYADTPATEVLKELADNGAVNAAKVLKMHRHPGYPKGGQTWGDWLETTSIREFDGRLKLISYERNLAGDRVRSTHDMWDLRFFLENMPDRQAAILGLSKRGGLLRYAETMKQSNLGIKAQEDAATKASNDAAALVEQLAEVGSARQRAKLEREIKQLKATAKAASTKGSRLRDLDSGQWRDYSDPSQGEYLLMSDIYTKMTEHLNAGDPEQWWSPERVQAAIWGLMRGDLAEDAPPGFDFLNITKDWIEGGTTPTRLREEFVAAAAAGTKDSSDIYARTSQEGVHPYGKSHPVNQYQRRVRYALDKLTGGKARHDAIAKGIADAISLSGQYTKKVAIALGAKKAVPGYAAGVYHDGMSVMATTECTASLSLQAARGQKEPLSQVYRAMAKRAGHMIAALNFQRATELAELPASAGDLRLYKLAVDNIDDTNQLIVKFRGAKSHETAYRTWEKLWTELGERSGKDKWSVIQGATIGLRGGGGELRVSIGPGYGVVDFESFWAHFPDLVDELGGELYGTKARAAYYDAEWELGDLPASSPWRARWDALQRAAQDSLSAGGPGEAEAAAARVGDLVSARHLHHALEGLDRKTRDDLLHHYALANRARLTEMVGLYNNPMLGEHATGNAITEHALVEQARIADGGVLRLLNELDGDGRVIDREMIDALSKEMEGWKGRERLPPAAQAYLTKAVDRQGSLGGIGNKKGLKLEIEAVGDGKKAVAGQKELKMHDILEPEDEAEIAAARLEQSSAQHRAQGDPDTADVHGRAAEFAADSLRQASNLSGEGANALDAAAAMQSGGFVPGLAKASLHIARRGYRSLFKNYFEPVENLNPRVSNLFNQVMSSDVQARQAAKRISYHVLKDMTLDEKRLFERFLQSQKAKIALQRAGNDVNKIGLGMRQMLMAPDLEKRVLQNPRIAEALTRHREKAMPQMVALLTAIDPDNANHLLRTSHDAFMPSMRYDPALHRLDVGRVGVDPPPAMGGSTKSLPSRFHVEKNTPSMKRFEGKAAEYVTDYEELLTWRLNRNTALAEQRRLLNALQEEGLTRATRIKDAEGNVVPAEMPTDTINGQQVRWRKIRTSDRPTWVRLADEATGEETTQLIPTGHEEIWVPDQVAAAWEYVKTNGGKTLQFGRNSDGKANAWFRFADFTTGAMLATVAEASRHSLRVLAMAVRVPDASPSLGNVGAALIPYFGPRGRKLWQMATAYDHPDAFHLEAWMARVGGLPERAFDETHVPFKDILPTDSLPKRLGKRAANTAIGSVHAGRGFLFDLPDVEARGWRMPFTERGGGPLGTPVPARLWGFDVRARLIATRTFFEHLKATGRIGDDVTVEQLSRGETPFDADLREFLTQFGMFNGKLQTRLVQRVKEARINPFAGSQGGFRPAELETLFGLHRLPKEGMTPMMKSWYAAQVMYGAWGGYMVALMAANQALAGHWPWENQNGHEFDLQVGTDSDGSPVYISANFIEPSFSRAMRTTGLRYLFDERFGYDVKERLPTAFVKKGANEILGFLAAGPPVQAASIALTGRAPYITDRGFLEVAPPHAKALPRLVRDQTGTHLVKGQVLQNIVTAGVNMNSYIAQMYAEETQTGKHAIDPRLKWSFEGAHLIFGKIGAIGQTPIVEAGTLARKDSQTLDKMVWFYWQKMQSAHGPEDRNKIQLELLRQLEPNQTAKALMMLNQLDISMPKAQMRRAVESNMLRGQK